MKTSEKWLCGPNFQLAIQMVYSICSHTIHITVVSWIQNTTINQPLRERQFIWDIPSNASLNLLHCIWDSEVHFLLRFWQTPKRSHMGYKPEVSEQILGGSFLLSRVPDSQAHHTERLDELACWGGRQQRQRSPQELSEGRQRRAQRKNREQSDSDSTQGPHICLHDVSTLRLKKVSIRCQYFPAIWTNDDREHLGIDRPNPHPKITALGALPTPTPPSPPSQSVGGNSPSVYLVLTLEQCGC